MLKHRPLDREVLRAIVDAQVDETAPAEQHVPDGWPGHAVPNFSEWLVGDVVLVAGDRTLPATAIETVQRSMLHPTLAAHAGFTHAALYIGDGMLVDATLADGVSRRSVWFYCQYRGLTFRRLPARSLSQAAVASIANVANRYVGDQYSLSEAAWSALMPGTAPNHDHLYCSTFVGLVIAQATGLLLWERPEHRPLYPATLAGHPELDVVPVEWRPLGRRRAEE